MYVYSVRDMVRCEREDQHMVFLKLDSKKKKWYFCGSPTRRESGPLSLA